MGILWDNYYIVSEQNNNTVRQDEGIDEILKEVKEINQSKDRVDISLKEYDTMKKELSELREKLSSIDKKYWQKVKNLTKILGFPVNGMDLFSLEIMDASIEKNAMLMEDYLIVKYKTEKY